MWRGMLHDGVRRPSRLWSDRGLLFAFEVMLVGHAEVGKLGGARQEIEDEPLAALGDPRDTVRKLHGIVVAY
jgi:hypothetical protein